ncbi:MAG: hypothetical protein U9R03_03780 [Candidatus Aerophobetes bacterium]|nr:hypothetical protein [Candidatus Aerophobetes bacterium]
MKCKATTKTGKPCKANALKGKEYCLAHDPDSKKKFKEITKRGGKAKKKVQVSLAPIQFKGGAGEVLDLLADTINRVRSEDMPPKIANTIGYLAGHMVKALEIAEIDSRLKKVERIVLERKTYS